MGYRRPVIRDRRAILALLTALNFLNYIDRAVIAAVLRPMKVELALSNFEAGVLNSAFLIGYFVTCPLFGARADKAARKRLIALGVAVWSLATVASGLSTGFWTLLVARTVVGIGEASFAVLAPTIIDDVTPLDRKGKSLAVFYLAIPAGYALGYIIGGTLSQHWHWRAAFLVPGAPGILLAASCLWIAEPTRKLADAKAKLLDGLREIVEIPLFRRAVLGYCAFTAAAGAFSYWGPNFLVEKFSQLNDEQANGAFGVALLAGGLIGTFIGGFWADRGLGRLPQPAADAPYNAREHKLAINVLLRVCAVGMVVAAPLSALGFLAPGPTVFFVGAFMVDIGLFLSASPVNAAVMRAVPVERRASAMAASIFSIHLFGDLWSSAALGGLLDVLPHDLAMMSLPLTFGVAAYAWWPRKREAAMTPEARVHAQS
jgi:MFS family permease